MDQVRDKSAFYHLESENSLFHGYKGSQPLQDHLREVCEAGCEVEALDHLVLSRLEAVLYSKETHEHILRVSKCAGSLARIMKRSSWEVALIERAALYHDVGKHDLPDEILNKPGLLTHQERQLMETHTLKGWAMLMPSESPVYKAAATIARQHHERYNGSGYPDGRTGAQIHLYGRIVAVADVFDALVSERVYKKPWPLEQAMDHFHEQRCLLYDPEVVEAFDQFCHSLTTPR